MQGALFITFAGLIAQSLAQTISQTEEKFSSHLPVDIRCKTDTTNKLHCGVHVPKTCQENWNFKNPCTPANLARNLTLFPHPFSEEKFLMCGDFGKLFVVLCPRYEVFHKGCRQCVAKGSKLTATCEVHDVPLSETVTSNPCTTEAILAGKLFYPFPGDLGKYIHCDAWGKAWEMICTPGEIWDPYKIACVNPRHVNPCAHSTRAPGHLFKHPCDPTQFIRCDAELIPYEVPCGANEYFSEINQVCQLAGQYTTPPLNICGLYNFRFRSYTPGAFATTSNQQRITSTQTRTVNSLGTAAAGNEFNEILKAWKDTVSSTGPMAAGNVDMGVQDPSMLTMDGTGISSTVGSGFDMMAPASSGKTIDTGLVVNPGKIDAAAVSRAVASAFDSLTKSGAFDPSQQPAAGTMDVSGFGVNPFDTVQTQGPSNSLDFATTGTGSSFDAAQTPDPGNNVEFVSSVTGESGSNTFNTVQTSGINNKVDFGTVGTGPSGSNTFDITHNSGPSNNVDFGNLGSGPSGSNTFDTTQTSGPINNGEFGTIEMGSSGSNTFDTAQISGQNNNVDFGTLGSTSSGSNTFDTIQTSGPSNNVDFGTLGAGQSESNTFDTTLTSGQINNGEFGTIETGPFGSNTFDTTQTSGPSNNADFGNLKTGPSGSNPFDAVQTSGQTNNVEFGTLGTGPSGSNTFDTVQTSGPSNNVEFGTLETGPSGSNAFDSFQTTGPSRNVEFGTLETGPTGSNTFDTVQTSGQSNNIEFASSVTGQSEIYPLDNVQASGQTNSLDFANSGSGLSGSNTGAMDFVGGTQNSEITGSTEFGITSAGDPNTQRTASLKIVGDFTTTKGNVANGIIDSALASAQLAVDGGTASTGSTDTIYTDPSSVSTSTGVAADSGFVPDGVISETPFSSGPSNQGNPFTSSAVSDPSSSVGGSVSSMNVDPYVVGSSQSFDPTAISVQSLDARGNSGIVDMGIDMGMGGVDAYAIGADQSGISTIDTSGPVGGGFKDTGSLGRSQVDSSISVSAPDMAFSNTQTTNANAIDSSAGASNTETGTGQLTGIDALAKTIGGIIASGGIPGVEFASASTQNTGGASKTNKAPIVEAAVFGPTDTSNLFNGAEQMVSSPMDSNLGAFESNSAFHTDPVDKTASASNTNTINNDPNFGNSRSVSGNFGTGQSVDQFASSSGGSGDLLALGGSPSSTSGTDPASFSNSAVNAVSSSVAGGEFNPGSVPFGTNPASSANTFGIDTSSTGARVDHTGGVSSTGQGVSVSSSVDLAATNMGGTGPSQFNVDQSMTGEFGADQNTIVTNDVDTFSRIGSNTANKGSSFINQGNNRIDTATGNRFGIDTFATGSSTNDVNAMGISSTGQSSFNPFSTASGTSAASGNVVDNTFVTGNAFGATRNTGSNTGSAGFEVNPGGQSNMATFGANAFDVSNTGTAPVTSGASDTIIYDPGTSGTLSSSATGVDMAPGSMTGRSSGFNSMGSSGIQDVSVRGLSDGRSTFDSSTAGQSTNSGMFTNTGNDMQNHGVAGTTFLNADGSVVNTAGTNTAGMSTAGSNTGLSGINGRTGFFGDGTTGMSNTGMSNTGMSNTRFSNTGMTNAGMSNIGMSTSGVSNTGMSNTGMSNTGMSNTGFTNTGMSNTGISSSGVSGTGLSTSNTRMLNTGVSNTGMSRISSSGQGSGSTSFASGMNQGGSTTVGQNTGLPPLHPSLARAYDYSEVPFAEPCTKDNIMNSRTHFRIRNYPHSFIQCNREGSMYVMKCNGDLLFDVATRSCYSKELAMSAHNGQPNSFI